MSPSNPGRVPAGILIPSGKPWHGATDKTTMGHLALQESNNKAENLNRLEKVTHLHSLQPGEHE